MVMLGDVLKKTSAVFGEDMWEAHDFSRVMYAIKTRSGPVSLVFERAAQALHTRGLAWQTASKGRAAGWYPENRASGSSRRPNEADYLAEDFIESAEDVVESTSGWGSQPHEEELAAAFEMRGAEQGGAKPGSHNYGADAFFTQRESVFPGQGFGDIAVGSKPRLDGSGVRKACLKRTLLAVSKQERVSLLVNFFTGLEWVKHGPTELRSFVGPAISVCNIHAIC